MPKALGRSKKMSELQIYLIVVLSAWVLIDGIHDKVVAYLRSIGWYDSNPYL